MTLSLCCGCKGLTVFVGKPFWVGFFLFGQSVLCILFSLYGFYKPCGKTDDRTPRRTPAPYHNMPDKSGINSIHSIFLFNRHQKKTLYLPDSARSRKLNVARFELDDQNMNSVLARKIFDRILKLH